MGLWGRVQAVPGWFDARLEPLRRTRPWRAWSRYNAVRGNVLAGGIAYFAFFSLFPAMALGFTAFAVVLGEREDLQVRLVQYVNSNLGSRIISYRSSGGGVVSVEQLTQVNVLTTAGALSFVVLVVSGLGLAACIAAFHAPVPVLGAIAVFMVIAALAPSPVLLARGAARRSPG